jgi:hypothetical protein
MCLLHFLKKKKKKKINPSINKFENELFYDFLIIDKYSMDFIESLCKCSNF